MGVQYEVAAGFKANLKRHRKRAGYSQEEVGFLAGIHRTEVGMLERGIRVPRIDTLIKLASALEIPPGDLLEGIVWTRGASAPQGQFSVEPRAATLARRAGEERAPSDSASGNALREDAADGKRAKGNFQHVGHDRTD